MTGPVETRMARWSGLSAIRAGTGTVRCLAPAEEGLLADMVSSCRADGISLMAIGRGSNLIGSDKSLPWLAVLDTSRLRSFALSGDGLARVQCGMPLPAFIEAAAGEGYGGLHRLAGIPGSIGGALAMNAGANGASIADFVVEIDGIDLQSGGPWHWREGDGGWAYRKSPVPGNVCVTSALIKLEKTDAEKELEAIGEEKRRRAAVTPRGRSCGSVFMNPPEAPAGRLLEEAGCKGMAYGAFEVSMQHANWIVNPGGLEGRACDCLELVARMQARVQEKFGIALKTEWRVVDREAEFKKRL